MFRSVMHIITPLIMNMNMICEYLRLFLRTWRSLAISSHVNLVFVRYFDEMYVVFPLVVSCERRLHDTSSYLGLRECIVE